MATVMAANSPPKISLKTVLAQHALGERGKREVPGGATVAYCHERGSRGPAGQRSVCHACRTRASLIQDSYPTSSAAV